MRSIYCPNCYNKTKIFYKGNQAKYYALKVKCKECGAIYTIKGTSKADALNKLKPIQNKILEQKKRKEEYNV